MCELSADGEGQQSEQNDGDRNRCDDWNNRAENWIQNEMMGCRKIENGVQHEMMNDHKIENRFQMELTDGHKSWNKRIWYRNWIRNKMTGCPHKMEQKLGHQVVQKLDSERVDGWSQQFEQKLAKRFCA